MSTQDALASLSQGDIESAKTILDNATQVTGGESSMESVFAASCMRAAIAAMEGSAEEVKRVMGGSSKRNDPHWDALTSYQEGLSQMALGNYKLAKSKFLESKNKDPCFFVANIGIAALLFQEKKYKESFAKYKEAIFYLGSEKVPPVARVGMALCAFYLDDKEFAEKTLDVALSVNQEDELALLARLLLYVEKQNLQKISETVDQLSRVTPSNPLVLLKYADLMYFKAVSERNVASYFPSISAVLDNVRLNGSPEECALADYHGGRLFLACGDYIKAKALLQSALRFFPNLLSARIQYTNAFLLSGDIKHGLELLVNLQKEYPNQKEIQELMCVYASENGVYDVALQCSRRLSASVEQGDINSSMISLWCSRFSSAEHSRLLAQVIKLLKTMQQEVPLELYCNYATATEDADALQALIDNELGGNVLEKDSLSAQHIPLLYNLALLLEKNGKDEPRAKKIHMHIIKHHGCFVPSYIRLHELARRRGSMKESVSWLTLLSQVMSDEPIARSYLGNLLLEEQEVLLSTKLLRGCSENSALTAILSCASAYFELSQIPSQNGESYLKKSKQMFQYALRRDSSNILAAHGLACCLGVEQNFEVCQLLLKHINEVIPNADFVRQSHSAHMANIKTISETFKGAVDYAEKEEKRTPELECMLAFCLSVENQYDKAIEICERVAKENPNEPMFSYNLVLLLLAAFNHGLCGHSPLSMADGEKFRDYLQKGEELAKTILPILEGDKRSSTYKQASVSLKYAIKYCIAQYQIYLRRKLSLGQLKSNERETQSKKWSDTLKYYNDEVQQKKQEEEMVVRINAEKRKRDEEELLESFATRPIAIRTDTNGLLYAAIHTDNAQQNQDETAYDDFDGEADEQN